MADISAIQIMIDDGVSNRRIGLMKGIRPGPRVIAIVDIGISMINISMISESKINDPRYAGLLATMISADPMGIIIPI